MIETSRVHYPLFNYLRIILALTVAMLHAGLIPWGKSGTLAVEVFFVISGFLIGGILLRSQPGDLARFYFNRSARIWIPYFVAFSLLIGASLLRDPVTAKWLEFVIYKATFVYDLFGPPQLATYADQMPLFGTGNHFWSICAEEKFYLVAPLLLVLMPAAVGRSLLVWLLILISLFAFNISGLFGGIALGVVAAILEHRLGRWYATRTAIVCLSIGFLASCVMFVTDALRFEFIAPVFATCVVLLAARPGKESAFGDYLGGLSYPLYLNHWIGFFIANEIFQSLGYPHSTANGILGVVLALATCAVLYQYVDVPVRRNRDHFFTVGRGYFAAGAGYALVLMGLGVGVALT